MTGKGMNEKKTFGQASSWGTKQMTNGLCLSIVFVVTLRY